MPKQECNIGTNVVSMCDRVCPARIAPCAASINFHRMHLACSKLCCETLVVLLKTIHLNSVGRVRHCHNIEARILMIYFYGACGALAYLGIRYRDLQHALTSIFGMLFILTPVIYPPEILLKKGLWIVIYGNPFSSLIEIVRYPLIHHHLTDGIHYIIALAFTFIMIAIKFSAAKKWERFVPFWS